jgi:regulation of enolase protein 1 (concanavalin A-like superfamily)
MGCQSSQPQQEEAATAATADKVAPPPPTSTKKDNSNNNKVTTQQTKPVAKEIVTPPLPPPPLPPFRPVQGFGSIKDDDDDTTKDALLKWFCPPDGWTGTDTTDNDNNDNNGEDCKKSSSREGKGGWWEVSQGELLLAAPAKKDFWRKTYYEPLLVKDNAPFLYSTISMKDMPFTIETKFTIQPKKQFDQVGIVIRMDNEHWIKTGIEVVDGTPRLSCVVTNGFSDWSTQPWTCNSLRIRVHCLPQNGGSFVVEASPYNDEDEDDKAKIQLPPQWSLLRVCHLNRKMNHNFLNDHPTVQNAYKGIPAPPDSIMAGVFAACPEDQSGQVATFYGLSIVKGSSFQHDANVIHE